ncbi:HU family DNA-binding protein [Candidatus Phytoplasma solani]|uniref:DNA-binding protein HU n=1 Tax=Candidatus Phytoplasma solani TaxID=69896 RepID=A0A421NYN5_9MOLU|nr:HU family DNA-binding protein [Candidatus Phytoplasma solani]RMI89131.1 DNA-binding protein HU [Candidatus Phytoplasma solani]CCP88374.1 DNA-binding protein HU [Candidatus Phytoplasma solani]
MSKLEFLRRLAESHGVSQKEADRFLSSFVEVLSQSLQSFEEDEKVTLTGFGTFEVKRRNARQGKNPRTGKNIDIPAKTVPVFKFSKSFKDVFVS